MYYSHAFFFFLGVKSSHVWSMHRKFDALHKKNNRYKVIRFRTVLYSSSELFRVDYAFDSVTWQTNYLDLSQLRICRPPVLIRSLWKMRNVLKRMINKFSDFYFSSHHENSSKIGVIFSTKMTISLVGKYPNIWSEYMLWFCLYVIIQ